MNEQTESYFARTKDGCSVFFGGVEVADKLSQEQAGQLLDDLSYYGKPMYCVYNRKNCTQGEAICLRCPDRKEMEAGEND